MQSRTYLRIEGDLVSLISEVIDREVALPDLLAELTTTQVLLSPRLPTGCRFWFRAGTTDRQVFVAEQAPMRRTIEYHASRRHDSEPTSYRIALPYVVFVVSTYGEQIESLSTYFRMGASTARDDRHARTSPSATAAQPIRRHDDHIVNERWLVSCWLT